MSQHESNHTDDGIRQYGLEYASISSLDAVGVGGVRVQRLLSTLLNTLLHFSLIPLNVRLVPGEIGDGLNKASYLQVTWRNRRWLPASYMEKGDGNLQVTWRNRRWLPASYMEKGDGYLQVTWRKEMATCKLPYNQLFMQIYKFNQHLYNKCVCVVHQMHK